MSNYVAIIMGLLILFSCRPSIEKLDVTENEKAGMQYAVNYLGGYVVPFKGIDLSTDKGKEIYFELRFTVELLTYFI